MPSGKPASGCPPAWSRSRSHRRRASPADERHTWSPTPGRSQTPRLATQRGDPPGAEGMPLAATPGRRRSNCQHPHRPAHSESLRGRGVRPCRSNREKAPAAGGASRTTVSPCLQQATPGREALPTPEASTIAAAQQTVVAPAGAVPSGKPAPGDHPKRSPPHSPAPCQAPSQRREQASAHHCQRHTQAPGSRERSGKEADPRVAAGQAASFPVQPREPRASPLDSPYLGRLELRSSDPKASGTRALGNVRRHAFSAGAPNRKRKHEDDPTSSEPGQGAFRMSAAVPR